MEAMENGIYRAKPFKETTTTKREPNGVHAGRKINLLIAENNGCIRTTPEAMEAINNAIQEYGSLQSIVIQI